MVGHEEAIHLGFAVRKQGEINAGAQLILSFHLSLDPSPLDDGTHIHGRSFLFS